MDARPNEGSGQKPGNKGLLKTAAGCDPATASIDLDINNIRAKLMTGGDMWWDIGIGEARYEVPKGTKKNSLFAGSIWIGGFTADKQLKVAAQTYRQDGNDYWPGPLNKDNENINTPPSIDFATCTDWDKFWKIDRFTLNKFREMQAAGAHATARTSEFEHIWGWPARGNGAGGANSNEPAWRARGTSGAQLVLNDREYAPFVDVDGNGIYNPEDKDYPDILGDQFIWWVFNDMGNTKNQSKTEAIGVEVQASAFAFATKDYLNDATFYNYKLLNRGSNTLDSTYIATWTDADLGYYLDDYIGCDTVRGLGILYNGDNVDGTGAVEHYGTNIPMVGIDFFKGPKKIVGSDTIELKMEAFTYYNNNNDQRIGNPSNGVQIYNYMTGSGRNGQRFVNDFQGPGVPSTGLGQGTPTRFLFYGDPDKNEWSECTCGNPAADRRFVHSSGPFTLQPGAVNDITIGAVWVASVGGCPNTSFKKIRVADDMAQTLFDNGFKTIEGPEAPRMVVRELDKKLVFYLVNDPISTNYREKFGSKDSAKYRVAAVNAKRIGSPDSLYVFEGYRVFQLKNSKIQAAQIFNERGEVNTEVAKEVFQTDRRNGVKQLVNWTKNIDVVGCDNCYDLTVKVDGKDSGIVHSFEVSGDAFSTDPRNKGLVNYKTYYYVAIAYAYNNFANFDVNNPEETQAVVYLESSHGAGGTAIPVVAAMPNPFSGQVGTYTPTDFGDGVIIKKLEGIGNGGSDLQISRESENEALVAANGYISSQPIYEAGRGPVDVKVVDPYKVPAANWSLIIRHDTTKPGTSTVYTSVDYGRRLVDSTAQWLLVNETTNDVIYSERSLKVRNEQIIEKYGISVAVKQEVRPGDNKEDRNGYITSDVTFAETNLPWLAGVPDGEQRSPLNWIRSGKNKETTPPLPTCNYDDTDFDPDQFYESMFSNNSATRATWTPYVNGAVEGNSLCGFGTVKSGTNSKNLYDLQSVDLVFTKDKSKWSKCLVLEVSDEASLSEGGIAKYKIRGHRSWNGDLDANGNPVYSSNASDMGYSMFPGYAVSQETGQRLEIVFGEDSYLSNHNGSDMIWNPTSTITDQGVSIFGGRHYIYISKVKYDGGDSLGKLMRSSSTLSNNLAFNSFMWTGMPVINPGFRLLSLKDGLIPTETRLRFRVSRPYAQYVAPGVDTTASGSNKGFPKYSFSTVDLAPRKLDAAGNPYEKQALLDRIHAVPNPYYARSVGYEANRLDTRVRLINLPQRATITVYSLDGSLIRRIDKDNDLSYIDWDIRNAKGLPIASGMYLIHVNAEGIGETIIRWFGAMRPVDITTY